MSNTSPCKRSAYDIIIAGGGTAGCVLAARLSEVPGLHILLLEAGENQNDNSLVKTPGMYQLAVQNPELNWGYHVAPQEELNGRTPLLARGKGLGGSTLINALSLLYPSRAGFDTWVELGNDAWDWDSLVPYIKKFQNFNEPSEEVAKDVHLGYVDRKEQGIGGPIQASYERKIDPLDKAWVETFRNLGLDMKADTVSGKSLGGYQIVNTIDPKTRERSHAGNAYLAKAMHRSNLEIVTGALINKIVFEIDDAATEPKAIGVDFSYKDQTYVADTTGDGQVIICAGSIASPGILERSGIGNPTLLQDLGITPIISNNNVGENLHDHFLNGVSFELNEGISTLDDLRDMTNVQKAMGQYQQDGSGPMGNGGPSFAYMPLLEETNPASETNGHTTTTTTNTKPTTKLAQPTFTTLINKHLGPDPNSTTAQTPTERVTRRLLTNPSEASASLAMIKIQGHLNYDKSTEMFAPSDPGNYITLCVAPSHPLSRGSVHSVSNSPRDAPIIDPKYYSHPLDMELVARHLQFFPTILSTPPLRDMVKPDGRTIPADAKFDTVDDTKNIMKQSVMSMQHPCGSCAMLPRESGGVVDTRLNVYGVRGVRVCDASIFPLIPRGTLMCTVYAVAERAADLIKEERGVL